VSRVSEQAACRIDLWLWRARFFRSRSLAQRFVEAGGVRLTRGGREQRLDKASRTVVAGDLLVFALGPKLVAIRVLELGERRGPATEARGLYEALDVAEGASCESPG
jgi:ribosome-associated heat shock protein Hsp15